MLLAVLLAVVAVRCLAPLASRAGWVDKPNFRKVHEGEVPVIGGWAVFIAIIAAQIYVAPEDRAPLGYWLGALLLFVVAVVDDRFPIRARYRLAVQVAAAFSGVFLGGQMLPELGDLVGLGSTIRRVDRRACFGDRDRRAHQCHEFHRRRGRPLRRDRLHQPVLVPGCVDKFCCYGRRRECRAGASRDQPASFDRRDGWEPWLASCYSICGRLGAGGPRSSWATAGAC